MGELQLNWYNENDAYAAAWLGNLIREGMIPDGEVCEQDVRTVGPEEIDGFRQCHFFAGIGGWSLALRLAGWPEDREVWTGSCPCQPFSVAGKGRGSEDPRHLWPAWRELIRERRPQTIFGEQVASASVVGRISCKRPSVSAKVQTTESSERSDSPRKAPGQEEAFAIRPGRPRCRATGQDRRRRMRGDGSTVSASRRPDMGQSVSRPDCPNEGLHLQEYPDRLPRCKQCPWRLGRGKATRNSTEDYGTPTRCIECIVGEARRESQEASRPVWLDGIRADLEEMHYTVGACVLPAASVGAPHIRQRLWWVANADGREQGHGRVQRGGQHGQREEDGRAGRGLGDAVRSRHKISRADGGESEETTYSTSGEAPKRASFWSDFTLVPCGDGKQRRVESGVQPLAHGVQSRVGKLRAWGNAIVPQVAATFIRAFMQTE